MAKLTIPGELPDLNEIIAASKSHYGAYAKLKADHTNTIMLLTQRTKPVGRVFITCHWHCPNRRSDPDNVAAGGLKMILDGLVKAGVLQGDGWRHIAGFEHLFFVDKHNPRVEIFLLAENQKRECRRPSIAATRHEV